MLKLLPVFIFIIPGMIAFALAKSGQVPAIQQTLLDANGELVNENARRRSRCSWRTCCRSAFAAWSWPDCWPRS